MVGVGYGAEQPDERGGAEQPDGRWYMLSRLMSEGVVLSSLMSRVWWRGGAEQPDEQRGDAEQPDERSGAEQPDERKGWC